MPLSTLPIGLPFRRVSGEWSPADLPGFASSLLPGVSVGSGLWQDAAKTTPADADGEAVRVATCPYSGTDWVATSDADRFTLETAGGKWWLECANESTGQDLLGPVAATLGADATIVLRASADADAAASRILQSNDINAVLALRRTDGACVFAGGIIHGAALVADALPHTVVLRKAAAGNWSLTLDGVSQSVGAVATDWGRVGVGGAGTTDESWDGRLYGLIVCTAALDAADVARASALVESLS